MKSGLMNSRSIRFLMLPRPATRFEGFQGCMAFSKGVSTPDVMSDGEACGGHVDMVFQKTARLIARLQARTAKSEKKPEAWGIAPQICKRRIWVDGLKQLCAYMTSLDTSTQAVAEARPLWRWLTSCVLEVDE